MFYYRAEPAMRPINPTVDEIVKERGLDGFFDKTNVDELTQKALYYFFQYDRACDPDTDKFLWFWRRRLYRYYPVYKNQVELWAARKTYDWFYDLNKGYKLTHDGSFHLDEQTKDEIEKQVVGAMKEIFGKDYTIDETIKVKENIEVDENINFNEKTEVDENINETFHETGSDSYVNNDSGITRDFMFNYPESNYTGGVLPYNLDYEKNPMNVEFINTQEDKIHSDTLTHTGDYQKDSTDATVRDTDTNRVNNTVRDTDTDKSTTTDKDTDTREDSETNRDTTENTDETKDGIKNQDTETHWVEKMERNEIKVNDLFDELLDDMPETDFFNQFVKKLRPCFMNMATFDELEVF